MTIGLTQVGNWLLLAGALLFVLSVFNALRAARQLRGAAYYAVRQDALNRTRRWALLATVSLLFSGGLIVYLTNSSVPTPTAIATGATPTLVVVDVPSRLLPTETFTPSATPKPSKTPKPTSTTAPTLTPTTPPPLPPAPSVPAILLTPVPSAVPASPNAKLAFTTLASIVDSKGTPADPGLAFPVGTRSVRLFFQASNVNNGAAWSVLCYKGNKLVDSYIDLWDWGPRTQTARAFCGIDGSPGAYIISAYLGSNKQFDVNFTILQATPTPLPPVKP